MGDLTTKSLGTALSRHTRAVQQDNWQVRAGISTTQFTVSLVSPAGTASSPIVPNVLDGSDYTGCQVEFTDGANSGAGTDGAATTTGRVSATIQSVTSSGSPVVTTVTLNQALPNVPAAGDQFTVYRQVANVTVSAPENLTQVGSQNVPVDDSGFARIPVTDFATEVNNATVAAGQIRFVASGDERAYNSLTVNGYERVNGSLYVNSLTVGAGGKVVIGTGGAVTLGAFN